MASTDICYPASASAGHWFENFENQMNKMQQTFLRRSHSHSGMEMPQRLSTGSATQSWKLLDTIEPFKPEEIQITIAQDGKSISLDAKSEQTTSDGGKISRAISKRWTWTEAVDAASLKCCVKNGVLTLETSEEKDSQATATNKAHVNTATTMQSDQHYATVSISVASATPTSSEEKQKSFAVMSQCEAERRDSSVNLSQMEHDSGSRSHKSVATCKSQKDDLHRLTSASSRDKQETSFATTSQCEAARAEGSVSLSEVKHDSGSRSDKSVATSSQIQKEELNTRAESTFSAEKQKTSFAMTSQSKSAVAEEFSNLQTSQDSRYQSTKTSSQPHEEEMKTALTANPTREASVHTAVRHSLDATSLNEKQSAASSHAKETVHHCSTSWQFAPVTVAGPFNLADKATERQISAASQSSHLPSNLGQELVLKSSRAEQNHVTASTIQVGSVANACRLFENFAEKEKDIKIRKVDTSITEQKLRTERQKAAEDVKGSEASQVTSQHQRKHHQLNIDAHSASQGVKAEKIASPARKPDCEQPVNQSKGRTEEIEVLDAACVTSSLIGQSRNQQRKMKIAEQDVEIAQTSKAVSEGPNGSEQPTSQPKESRKTFQNATRQHDLADFDLTAAQQTSVAKCDDIQATKATHTTAQTVNVTKIADAASAVEMQLIESAQTKSNVNHAHQQIAGKVEHTENVTGDFTFIDDSLFSLENQFWENRQRALRQSHETSEKLQQEYLQNLHWPNIFGDSRVIRSNFNDLNTNLNVHRGYSGAVTSTTESQHTADDVISINSCVDVQKKIANENVLTAVSGLSIAGSFHEVINGFDVKENKVTANEFKVALDVAGCPAENLSVRVMEDTRLVVEARWIDGFTDRLARREWILPQKITEDCVRCTLTSDGILVINVSPLSQLANGA